jgi:serine/threonine protein kinase
VALSTFGAGPEKLERGQCRRPYRLRRLLGEGGMAHVFLAARKPDGEEVALKALKADLSGREVHRRR